MIYLLLENIKKRNLFLIVFNFFTVLFIVIPFFLIIANVFSYEQGVDFAFVNRDAFSAFARSFWVSIFVIIFVFCLSYPFAYFISTRKNDVCRSFLIAFITSPLWSSFFVKLLGLKSFFDLLNGSQNSTIGLMYVIIGLIYINLPLAILSFYNVLKNVPENIFNAALDLGHDGVESIFRIVIPYTKEAIASSIFLIFLPSFTSVSVPEILNAGNNSKLIGQIINSYTNSGTSGISSQRISTITLVLVFVVFLLYLFFNSFSNIFKNRKDD